MKFRTRLTISFLTLATLLIAVEVLFTFVFTAQPVYRLLLTVLLLLIAILANNFLVCRLSKPLESLTLAVKKIGDSSSDPLDLLPERTDEFALLQKSIQDVSFRLHESMTRLTNSEERFHSLFDAMMEGAALHTIVYNQEGIPVNYLIDDVNQEYLQLLNIDREQVVGKYATDIYQTHPPLFINEFSSVVATGIPCRFDAYLAQVGRHFNISACRVGPLQFATLFFDITERKHHDETLRTTMEQLKHANEAKSRFLAVMSHEIRTPLNGITGMIQLLRDMDMPPAQKEYLNFIDSSADSLLNVINDVLDFSKIEAGKLELEQITFKPLAILNDSLRVMRLRARAKGLMLSLSASDQLPEVLNGDPYRLSQILNNLVSNAIKFTSAGEINVRVSSSIAAEGSILLTVEVQDTGIGMDEARQKAIFEPFTQAESYTSRKFGGTGLGLAICKQMVELMQGTIDVTSKTGFGSTFRFTVPLKPGRLSELEQVQQSSQPAADSGLENPLRVIVAEDQPVNQRFVAEILKKHGHQPLLANNGQEAFDIWKQDKVDLVLMDIQMPIMDGLKALAAIRAAEDGIKRHTPILALTAHAIVGDRERLLNAGFDGYLSKPLQVASLFEEMANVLEQINKEQTK